MTTPAPRRRPGRPRKTAPAPEPAAPQGMRLLMAPEPPPPPIPFGDVDEVTRAIALERSDGDRSRIRVIDTHTVLITNRPDGAR